MNRLPFAKYTSCGNNFVIVDETSGSVAPEHLLSKIAYVAIDGCFGVGADNFVVVQRCSDDVLTSIQANRGYWTKSPDAATADYLFRMFEPDGVEALSCGNGLLSVAQYLHDQHGCETASVMTRVPLCPPAVVDLGVSPQTGRAWVNLGPASRMPESLVDHAKLTPVSDDIDLMDDIQIGFRKYDLAPFFNNTSLTFTGYVTFTGEPHFVVFPEGTLAEIMFGRVSTRTPSGEAEKRQRFGTWLLEHMGNFLNKRCGDLFPQGISINVGYVVDPVTIEYRTYERGIWRETLACGTGGVGVANVAMSLGLVEGESFTLIPHRCTWHGQDAELQACRGTDGAWLLQGRPGQICEGVFKADVAASSGPVAGRQVRDASASAMPTDPAPGAAEEQLARSTGAD